jgi:quercetin dioxygenase-like cupin family protein
MYIIRKQDLPLIGSSFRFVGADHAGVRLSMFLVEAKPGRGAPLHCHDYDEVILVQEGTSRFVAGDEIRDTSPGEIIVVKAGTPHGFVNSGSGILKQTDLHLSARFAQTNLAPTETSRAAGLPE